MFLYIQKYYCVYLNNGINFIHFISNFMLLDEQGKGTSKLTTITSNNDVFVREMEVFCATSKMKYCYCSQG